VCSRAQWHGRWKRPVAPDVAMPPAIATRKRRDDATRASLFTGPERVCQSSHSKI